MKNNSLLLLASLAVFATGASAAQNQIDSETLVLPTYVVETPRYQPFEQHINASLNELRLQAQTPLAVTPELAAPKTQVRPDASFVRTAREVKVVHVAKS